MPPLADDHIHVKLLHLPSVPLPITLSGGGMRQTATTKHIGPPQPQSGRTRERKPATWETAGRCWEQRHLPAWCMCSMPWRITRKYERLEVDNRPHAWALEVAVLAAPHACDHWCAREIARAAARVANGAAGALVAAGITTHVVAVTAWSRW